MSSMPKGDKPKSDSTTKPELPPAPEKKKIDPSIAHYDLWVKVNAALTELPSFFETETVIAGLQATDIFNLNAVLGATIEFQVVQTLNKMRSVWDPDDRYKLYSFIRQSQTFPDVLLAKRKTNSNKVER